MTTVKSEAAVDRPATARERLLRAADELFYAEGINSVGIDRVIEHAGVAKASLYSCFGSKDQLIRAYLLHRHELRMARIERHQAKYTEPAARMLAVFESLEELYAGPESRGCPFVAAAGESRTDVTVREIAAITRAYTRERFAAEGERLGVADPKELAADLALLYDGAVVASQMEADRGAPARARRMAQEAIARALG